MTGTRKKESVSGKCVQLFVSSFRETEKRILSLPLERCFVWVFFSCHPIFLSTVMGWAVVNSSNQSFSLPWTLYLVHVHVAQNRPIRLLSFFGFLFVCVFFTFYFFPLKIWLEKKRNLKMWAWKLQRAKQRRHEVASRDTQRHRMEKESSWHSNLPVDHFFCPIGYLVTSVITSQFFWS